MKFSKTILTFLILLAAVQFCAGQEKPEAVLSDKFGKIYCDEFLGRLDSFFVELQNDPHSSGYAVIYTRENLSKQSLSYLNIIGGHIEFRKFDRDRVSIIRAKKDTEFEIELWRVPTGVEKPQFGESEWSNVLPDSTKAFVFTSSCCDFICPTYSLKDYADFLNANPNTRSHLAVYSSSIRKARKEGNVWLKELTGTYKIPRNRFKLFYSDKAHFSGLSPETYSGTEFWIVPIKKKK